MERKFVDLSGTVSKVKIDINAQNSHTVKHLIYNENKQLEKVIFSNETRFFEVDCLQGSIEEFPCSEYFQRLSEYDECTEFTRKMSDKLQNIPVVLSLDKVHIFGDSAIAQTIQKKFRVDLHFGYPLSIPFQMNLTQIFCGEFYGKDGRLILSEYLWPEDGQYYSYGLYHGVPYFESMPLNYFLKAMREWQEFVYGEAEYPKDVFRKIQFVDLKDRLWVPLSNVKINFSSPYRRYVE